MSDIWACYGRASFVHVCSMEPSSSNEGVQMMRFRNMNEYFSIVIACVLPLGKPANRWLRSCYKVGTNFLA